MAVKFEQTGDIVAAEKLMALALSGRPEGPFIKKKLEEYRTQLSFKGIIEQPQNQRVKSHF